MKKVNFLRFWLLLALGMATAVMSCKKDDNVSGVSSLVGKWTSVSATGKVTCGVSTLGVEVANAINSKISAYDLSGVICFEFDKNAVLAYSEHPGTLYHSLFKNYELNKNVLTMTQILGFYEKFEISMKGDEFSIHSMKNDYSEIEVVIGLALCEKEVRSRGYESMQQAGIQLTSFNLTVKYQKQKK